MRVVALLNFVLFNAVIYSMVAASRMDWLWLYHSGIEQGAVVQTVLTWAVFNLLFVLLMTIAFPIAIPIAVLVLLLCVAQVEGMIAL